MAMVFNIKHNPVTLEVYKVNHRQKYLLLSLRRAK